jgi:hypothetical protein
MRMERFVLGRMIRQSEFLEIFGKPTVLSGLTDSIMILAGKFHMNV